jgi:hypothetical protein
MRAVLLVWDEFCFVILRDYLIKFLFRFVINALTRNERDGAVCTIYAYIKSLDGKAANKFNTLLRMRFIQTQNLESTEIDEKCSSVSPINSPLLPLCPFALPFADFQLFHLLFLSYNSFQPMHRSIITKICMVQFFGILLCIL